MKVLRTTTLFAGTLLAGALAATPALAVPTSVTWTFGIDSYTGTTGTLNCTMGCNTGSIGYGQASFSSNTGGVPLILSAFSTTGSINNTPTNGTLNAPTAVQLTDKTMPPYPYAESGIGVTYNAIPGGNPDGEIQHNEAVLIDASKLPGGYSLTNLTIGSLQTNGHGGEGFKIFGLTSAQAKSFTTDMNNSATGLLPFSGTPTGWNLVKQYRNSGCGNVQGNCALESVNLLSASDPYYLVTDRTYGDVLLVSAGATLGAGNSSVPEPASMTLMAVGLGALGVLRLRRRIPA
ncbi:MAG: PEP-CTERM sorting domain-containing protein [Rhodospirillales bacterium]|nr:PEP-CTERM sorting domain-containing protein [Rhodospirillales bacterium]